MRPIFNIFLMREQWWTVREQWTHARLLFTRREKKKEKRETENATFISIQTLTITTV